MCIRDSGDTAPYFYGGRPAFHVSSVYVLLPYFIYLFYNDDTALKEHYQGMKKYTDFMLSQLDGRGLVSSMFVGEWAPPLSESAFSTTWDALPANIDNQLVTTCYLYYCLTIMQKSAEYLGLDSQSQLYAQRAVELKDNINSAFFEDVYKRQIFKMEILFYLLNLVVINHNYIAQLSAGNYGTRSKFRNLQLIKGID